MNRPANVPEGAYVKWEIELLDYEKQKVRKFKIMIWNKNWTTIILHVAHAFNIEMSSLNYEYGNSIEEMYYFVLFC